MKNVRIITLLNPWRLQAADGRTVVAKVVTISCDGSRSTGQFYLGKAIELDAGDGTLPHRADIFVAIPWPNVVGMVIGKRAPANPVAGTDPDTEHAPDPVTLTGPFTIQSSAPLRAYGGTGAGGPVGGGRGLTIARWSWDGSLVKL